MNQTIKTLIGCLVPLLLIFLLPYFGITEGLGVFLFIVLMFACHLFMHGGGHGHDEHDNSQHKGEKYGRH